MQYFIGPCTFGCLRHKLCLSCSLSCLASQERIWIPHIDPLDLTLWTFWAARKNQSDELQSAYSFIHTCLTNSGDRNILPRVETHLPHQLWRHICVTYRGDMSVIATLKTDIMSYLQWRRMFLPCSGDIFLAWCGDTCVLHTEETRVSYPLWRNICATYRGNTCFLPTEDAHVSCEQWRHKCLPCSGDTCFLPNVGTHVSYL